MSNLGEIPHWQIQAEEDKKKLAESVNLAKGHIKKRTKETVKKISQKFDEERTKEEPQGLSSEEIVEAFKKPTKYRAKMLLLRQESEEIARWGIR